MCHSFDQSYSFRQICIVLPDVADMTMARSEEADAYAGGERRFREMKQYMKVAPTCYTRRDGVLELSARQQDRRQDDPISWAVLSYTHISDQTRRRKGEVESAMGFIRKRARRQR